MMGFVRLLKSVLRGGDVLAGMSRLGFKRIGRSGDEFIFCSDDARILVFFDKGRMVFRRYVFVAEGGVLE